MRALVSLSAVLGAIGAAAAGADTASISDYQLRLDTRTDGPSRAALTVVLDRIGNEVVVIPFPFPDLQALGLVEGPAGTTVVATPSNEQTNVTVTLPRGTAAPVTLRLSCDVDKALSDPTPAGRSVRLALLNSQPTTIRQVRIDVVFPAGLRGHAIREALPKPDRAEPGPRVVLEGFDGRSGARLQVDALPQGETASLRIELVSASASPGWLVVGLILSALYLRSFRDLVGRETK